MMTGDWAAAVSYSGLNETGTAEWLTDQFIIPDFSTGSPFDFDAYSVSNDPDNPVWKDPNQPSNPPYSSIQNDTGWSKIDNDKLEVTIYYEVVDLDPNNGSPISFADDYGSAYVKSERYVILQTYVFRNIQTTEDITDLEFYQVMHGHPADAYSDLAGSYNTVAISDNLENYVPYDSKHQTGNFRYDITLWNNTTGAHQDYMSFSSTVAPDEIGFDEFEYPSSEMRYDIENRTLNGRTSWENDDIAGAMMWYLPDLDPNESTSITLALMYGCGEPVENSLILTKTDDIDPNYVCGVDPSDPNNNEITYTIYYANPITNTSDPDYLGTVNDVVITDYLPNGTDPCDVTASGGGTYDIFTNTATWDISTLAPGEANSVTVTIEVISAEPAGEVVNTAILTSDVGWVKAVETTDICCFGGSIIYVDDTASGSNTGLNWNDAYNDLQAALARASECTTTEIWVASGIYMPDVINGNRNISFELVDDVEIYGGFNGTETLRSERDFLKNKTVLSGDIDPDGNNDTNKIVHADSTITSSAILDGFIITDGYDGIYCDSGDPTIKNCVIADNHDDGVYCTGSNMSISWSIIKENGGDGIECSGSGKNLTVNNNIIYYNGENGIYTFYSTATIKNSMIFYNGEDGTVYTVYYGVKLENPSDNPVIRNCTIADNRSEGIYYTGSNTPDISNSIIWHNNADNGYFQLSENCPVPTYSCITDPNDPEGEDPGADEPNEETGNISANPHFAYTYPNLSDYHLHPDSPCVDAGDPCDTYDGEKDIDGDVRVLNGVDYSPDNGRVDMGADEVACDDIYNSLDRNIDAIVDIGDIIILADAWLSDPCSGNWNPDCDLQPETGDGDVDYGDFVAFGSEWLWQPCWSSSGTGVWMMMGAGGGESMMTCGASAPVAFEPVATMSLEANDGYVVDEVANQLLETQRQFKMDQLTEARNQKAYYESPTPSEPSVEEQIEQIEELLDWLYEIKDETNEDTWLSLTTTLEEMLKDLQE
ncbi:MAG: hypothetical protein DRP65_05790 [Planctomycetota bacterium]|nr:MAG: hypothetical protein DRP65_05790 [Planctomycetota bacterium]